MVGCWGGVGLVVGVPGRAAAVKLLEVAVGPRPPGPLQEVHKTQGACGGHSVRREGPVQSTRAWSRCGSWGHLLCRLGHSQGCHSEGVGQAGRQALGCPAHDCVLGVGDLDDAIARTPTIALRCAAQDSAGVSDRRCWRGPADARLCFSLSGNVSNKHTCHSKLTARTSKWYSEMQEG